MAKGKARKQGSAAKGKGKGKGTKGKKGASGKKGKGKKTRKAVAPPSATELQALDLIGPDGAIERLLPRFRGDTYFYTNELPFGLDLKSVTVRAVALEPDSRVSIRAWHVPEPPPKKKKAVAGGPRKAGLKPKGATPKGKSKAGNGGSKKFKKSTAGGIAIPPPHIVPLIGRQLIAAASEGAAPRMEGGAPAGTPAVDGAPAAAPPPPDDVELDAEEVGTDDPTPLSLSTALLPAFVLATLRAEAPRIYDALRGAGPATERLSRDAWYALLHGLRLGVGRRDADELFTLADTHQAERVTRTQLATVLRACRPGAWEREVAAGPPPDFARPDEPGPDAWPDTVVPASPPGSVPGDESVSPSRKHGEDAAKPAWLVEIESQDAAGAGADLNPLVPAAAPTPVAGAAPGTGDAEVPKAVSYVRITVAAPDGTARAVYCVQVLCAQPPTAPPPQADVAPVVRRLFSYYAALDPPHAALAPAATRLAGDPGHAADGSRTVDLPSFISCARSTALIADPGAARDAFLHCNRHKETARLDLRGFWTAVYFSFARLAAAPGTWEHASEAALDAARAAIVPLAWNMESCAKVEVNRSRVTTARATERRKRNDQGRAQLVGDRWSFAPNRLHDRAATPARDGTAIVDLEGPDSDDGFAPDDHSPRDGAGGPPHPRRLNLVDLPDTAGEEQVVPERMAAYMAHMQGVWKHQEHARLWIA